MDNRISEREKKIYVSLYKKNSLPYFMVLLAILAEFMYVVVILDVMAVSYLMGVTVMLNIILLFSLFTCAMKVNVYNRVWGCLSVGLGIYMLIRMAVLIPIVLAPYNRQEQIAAANVFGGIILIISGLISVKRTTARQQLQRKLDQQKTDVDKGKKYGETGV